MGNGGLAHLASRPHVFAAPSTLGLGAPPAPASTLLDDDDNGGGSLAPGRASPPHHQG